jgi:hypothetical protein
LILSALVFLCCTAAPAETPKNTAATPVVEQKLDTAAVSGEDAKPAKPDTPTPKIYASASDDVASATNADPAAPSLRPVLSVPVKPAARESFETPRQRKIWYGLMATGHAAAAFDAWTTRRAVSGGYGVEANPMERPFANSGAIYATTQICPAIMDYVGRRMMRSSHPWMRQMWWLPQAASASFSLGAGIHNYTVVH